MRKKHIEPPPDAHVDESEQVLTITEVAARWRVNRHTVEAAIKAGRLQAFKPDQRVWRIRKAEVLRYEQQHMAPSAVAS